MTTFKIISIHTHIAEGHTLNAVQEVAQDGTIVQEFPTPGPHDTEVKL